MDAEALILRDFVAALQMLTLVPGSPKDQEVMWENLSRGWLLSKEGSSKSLETTSGCLLQELQTFVVV